MCIFTSLLENSMKEHQFGTRIKTSKALTYKLSCNNRRIPLTLNDSNTKKKGF